MKDKNGKYITKPRMKFLVAKVIANHWPSLNKDTEEMRNLAVKIQGWMDEYKFSRKSIFMTVQANFHLREDMLELKDDFYNKLHLFCYGILRDGK